MKVAINARCLNPNQTDQVSRFTYGLLKSISQNYPEHELYLLFQKAGFSEFKKFPNVKSVVLKPAGKHPLLVYWWFQMRLPQALRKIKPDVFLSTDGHTLFKALVPRVTFLPEINSANATLSGSFINRKYYRDYQARVVRESERLLAPSEVASTFMAEEFKIETNLVSTVLPAANAVFTGINFGQQVAVRQKYAAGESYFLLPELPAPDILAIILSAFALFKQRTRNELKLIIVGNAGNKGRRRTGKDLAIPEVKEDIIYTGAITTSQLAHLYGAAVATIYSSNFYGLNLPILEAQQSNCPVICLHPDDNTMELTDLGAINITLPEPEILFDALVRVYHDLDARTRLINAGGINARKYSWKNSSQQFMQLLEEVVNVNKNAAAPV